MSPAAGAAGSGQEGSGPGGASRAEAVLTGAPGEIRSPDRDVALAPGRARRRLRVASRSARPIRVSSHYPFSRVNSRLEFDRPAAAGFRLDIPAGTSLRWAPGEVKTVDLVAAADLPAPGPDGAEAPGAGAQGRPGPQAEPGRGARPSATPGGGAPASGERV